MMLDSVEVEKNRLTLFKEVLKDNGDDMLIDMFIREQHEALGFEKKFETLKKWQNNITIYLKHSIGCHISWKDGKKCNCGLQSRIEEAEAMT